MWHSITTGGVYLDSPFTSSVTNCIIEDKILIDANLISQIMGRPTMYIDTSMLIDWVKFELHIGKLKPDIRDLAKHNLNILKSRYVGKYDVIVPQMVVGEFCMVILEYYSDNLNSAMSWLSNFICKCSLDVKPIPKYKAYSITCKYLNLLMFLQNLPIFLTSYQPPY